MKEADLIGMTETAKASGAAAAAVIDTADIQFVPEFRAACEANTCGHYEKNWMCPPAVGSPEELKAEALKYSKGVVFQTVYQLEDSYDFEGMQEARDIHEKVFRNLFGPISAGLGNQPFLPLNVGGCKFCEKCTYPEGEPCRCPEKAVASLEAYCIDVNDLLTKYGIPYNNGPATVSFVGLFLFHRIKQGENENGSGLDQLIF